MIANLNIVTKTFAKMFDGLLATIIAIRKTCPYSSFRSKICKNGLQKRNLCEKTGQGTPGLQKSILAKVNHQTWSKSTVNTESQRSTEEGQHMTSAG